MKWASLLKDLREKVGLSQTPSPASAYSPSSSSAASSPFRDYNASSSNQEFSSSPSRFVFFIIFFLFPYEQLTE